jgi:hypothetical protein
MASHRSCMIVKALTAKLEPFGIKVADMTKVVEADAHDAVNAVKSQGSVSKDTFIIYDGNLKAMLCRLPKSLTKSFVVMNTEKVRSHPMMPLMIPKALPNFNYNGEGSEFMFLHNDNVWFPRIGMDIDDAASKAVEAIIENIECCICLEPMNDKKCASLLKCGHQIHTECMLEWKSKKNNTCPLCRKKIV